MVKENTRQSKKYPDHQIDLSPDPNTNELIAKILDRDKEGMDEFKITMRDKMLKDPTNAKFWLQEGLEEAIDLCRYLINSIISYNLLNEKYKKLLKENKELKETNKMLYEHP
jgi:hypothetical protein